MAFNGRAFVIASFTILFFLSLGNCVYVSSGLILEEFGVPGERPVPCSFATYAILSTTAYGMEWYLRDDPTRVAHMVSLVNHGDGLVTFSVGILSVFTEHRLAHGGPTWRTGHCAFASFITAKLLFYILYASVQECSTVMKEFCISMGGFALLNLSMKNWMLGLLCGVASLISFFIKMVGSGGLKLPVSVNEASPLLGHP